MLTSFAKTHIGQRTTNEDFILVDEKLGLYVVADGVGGLEKADMASKIASQKVLECTKKGRKLDSSVYEAHGALVDLIESNNTGQGMATTIAAVLFKGNKYQISWVGDTRVYLWDKTLKLLTKDDSHVEIYFDKGLISIEDLDMHPDRNYITQALGMRRKEITINNNFGTLEKNQVLLVCSDGLYRVANEAKMTHAVSQHKDMKQLTENLVNFAVDNNGMDNISLISIHSNQSTSRQEVSIKPQVVREFDVQTGKINIVSLPLDQQETDPNLVDITKLQELTQLEKDLLETAFKQLSKSQEKKHTIIPIVLIIFVVLMSILLYLFR